MWTSFVALSFAAGLAMFVRSLSADLAGWNHMNTGLPWLLEFLPLASVLILGISSGLAMRGSGLRWLACGVGARRRPERDADGAGRGVCWSAAWRWPHAGGWSG